MNPILKTLYKYKIHHVAFWIGLFFYTIHLRRQFQGGPFIQHLSNTLSQLSFQMVAVYAIIYGLIPAYLEKNRLLIFVLYTALTIVATAFLQVIFHKLLLLIVSGKAFVTGNILLYTITGVTDTAVLSVLFIAATILKSSYDRNRKNRKLEKEKLEAELNFLKSQTSPHFLFNALNSIYVLIDLDQKKAKDILLKFSNLLRYQLYETNGAGLLSTEIEFLENYIELEKTRIKNLKVEFVKPDNIPPFEMAPFLLVPLIENAFKHISHYTEKENMVRVKISVTERKFSISISNTVDEVAQEESQVGGIGLKNIRRRLDLLFPGRYDFNISRENHIFNIELSIYAEENKLHHR